MNIQGFRRGGDLGLGRESRHGVGHTADVCEELNLDK